MDMEQPTSSLDGQVVLPQTTSSSFKKFVPIAVLLLASIFIWFLFFKGSDRVSNVAPSFSLTKYVPAFTDTVSKPDPLNKDILWIFSRKDIRTFNLVSGEVKDYSEILGYDYPLLITDVVPVGEKIIVAAQGELVVYNTKTKSSRHFSEKDGMVSASNMDHVVPDPVDNNVIWVGTFKGLVKLNIVSGKIQNFVDEMGIARTAEGREYPDGISAKVFQVDDKYVWVSVGANAYTTGGIARFEKSTNTWKAWNVDAFKYPDAQTYFGETKNYRVDPFAFMTDDNRAVVHEDNFVYVYDSSRDVWTPTDSSLVPNKKTEEIPFEELQAKGVLFDVALLDATSDSLLVNTKEGLGIYSLESGLFKILSPRKATDARMFDDKALALNIDSCELCGPKQELYATSSIFSLDSGHLESQAVLHNTVSVYSIGKTLEDVYLFVFNYAQGDRQDGVQYHHDYARNTFVSTSSPSTLPPTERNVLMGNLPTFFVSNTNGKYQVLPIEQWQEGDLVTVTIENQETERKTLTATVSVPRQEYSKYTAIWSYAFSPDNQEELWVGTDRGLIRFNLGTGEYRVFTKEDGLLSNVIKRVFVGDGSIIIEHANGIASYNRL